MSISTIVKGATLKGNIILVSMPPRIIQGNVNSVINSGTLTMSLTTPPTSGNLMIAIPGVLASRVFTPPAGWTASVAVNSAGGSQAVFWKIAGGSETNSYAFTITGTPDWGGYIYEVVDFSSSTPIQFTGSNTFTSVKTVVCASASQNVATNSLVFATIQANGNMGITPNPSNSFVISLSIVQNRVATRRYFVSSTSQNTTWTWQTTRSGCSLFFAINPR